MANQTPLDDFKEGVKQINSELIVLLKINKKGLPRWKEWYEQGKKPECGVGLTYYLALYPKQRKKYVKKYAETVYELYKATGTQVTYRILKDAISEVFASLIKEGKAIGFGVVERFWQYVWALTTEAYQSVMDRQDINDKEMGKLLQAAIVDYDTEERILEKLFRDSLDEPQKTIWDNHKAGFGIRHTAEELGMSKTRVHEILQELKSKEVAEE